MRTFNTNKFRLRQPAFFGYSSTITASLGGVFGINFNQSSATPIELILKLSSEFIPALIKDTFVESGFSFNIFPRRILSPFGRLAHIRNFQIFNNNHLVFVCYFCRCFMKKIFASICNFFMNSLDLVILFFPIVRKFSFSRKFSLFFSKFIFNTPNLAEPEPKRFFRPDNKITWFF